MSVLIKFGTHSFNKRYLKESETHWHQPTAWPIIILRKHTAISPGSESHEQLFHSSRAYQHGIIAIRPCMIRVIFRGSPHNTHGSHWLGTAWQFIVPKHALARKVLCHTCQLSPFSRKSPSFSSNLPISRLEHKISRIKWTFEHFCALVWNLVHFFTKFELF